MFELPSDSNQGDTGDSRFELMETGPRDASVSISEFFNQSFMRSL